MRIPRNNNVYGQLVAPVGLRAVQSVFEKLLGPGCASLFHARAGNATETLRLRTNNADFESLPLPGDLEYLFNGAVAGSIEDVSQFVRSLSAALTDAKIDHTLDVHDGTRIVLSLPE